MAHCILWSTLSTSFAMTTRRGRFKHKKSPVLRGFNSDSKMILHTLFCPRRCARSQASELLIPAVFTSSGSIAWGHSSSGRTGAGCSRTCSVGRAGCLLRAAPPWIGDFAAGAYRSCSAGRPCACCSGTGATPTLSNCEGRGRKEGRDCSYNDPLHIFLHNG
jgi:hypothetical protein